MRANDLMKHNVKTLLSGRRQTQRDLAMWCRRSDAWIGKILSEDRREFPMKYWDRIADFFGISVYQLIQPGISALTERRRGERRVGQDRRLRNVARVARESALSDRSLIHEVIALNDDDRLALAATLAQMKHRKIAVPSTTTQPPVTATGGATHGITPSGKTKGTPRRGKGKGGKPTPPFSEMKDVAEM